MGHFDFSTEASLTSSFFLLLTTGFLTGLSHCVGMCGPLVSAFAMRRRAVNQELSTPVVLFQFGRLTTYTLLGLIMGGIGSAVNGMAIWQGWQGSLSIVLGSGMVLLGLGLLGWLPGQKWASSMAFGQLLANWLNLFLKAKHPLAPFGLGLVNGLLPCGPVYTVSLFAAASGNALQGALIMFIFGLATLPAMLGVAFSISTLGLRLRRHLFQGAAVLMVVVGIQLALRGLALNGFVAHQMVGGLMLW